MAPVMGIEVVWDRKGGGGGGGGVKKCHCRRIRSDHMFDTPVRLLRTGWSCCQQRDTRPHFGEVHRLARIKYPAPLKNHPPD